MKRRLLLLSPILFVACNFDHSLGNSDKDPDASPAAGADTAQPTTPPPDETKQPSPDAASPTQIDAPAPVEKNDAPPLSSFSGLPLPCKVITGQGTGSRCVSAHSTARLIAPDYTGPLYQLCKGTANPGPGSCQGGVMDIVAINGYADVASHDAFCAAEACTITKIYDQSGLGNDLEPAPGGGAKNTPDNPARANALPVVLNGHRAYGVLIKPGMGYRAGCDGCTIKRGNGMPLGDEPQSVYMVTSQKDLIDGCCFNYGNAETASRDDGNGTAEAINFSAGVVWGTGLGGKPGPWVMADLENGLYAGWENRQDKNISTNKPLKFDFVTAVLVGDVAVKNSGKGRFALYGADAQGLDVTFGRITAMYDGIRPEKTGYVPMQKQGSLVLGIAGDNSSGGGGRFYEGATIAGAALDTSTLAMLQASIVAAGYGSEIVVALPVDAGTQIDAPAPDAPVAQATDAPAPTPTDAQITNGGPTQSWTGYVENYHFASGSDRIKLVFTTDASGKVTGTVTFGNVPAPPPATDPNVGYPLGASSYDDKILEGPAFTIRNGSLQSYRLRFAVDTSELWAGWCALQTPPSDGSDTCIPNWSGRNDGQGQCVLFPPTSSFYGGDAGPDAWPAGTQFVDCAKMQLCQDRICKCSPSGCTVSSPDEIFSPFRFNGSFDVFLANGTGSGSVTGFTERNVHLIKD
jgi:hypothetical protein